MRAGAGLTAKVAGLPVGPQVEAKQLLPAKNNPGAGGWTWLGPGNIGGRTRSLLIHPRQPNVLWAGACGGGVWTSTDGGTNWLPCSDFMASLAISCLALHPQARHPLRRHRRGISWLCRGSRLRHLPLDRRR